MIYLITSDAYLSFMPYYIRQTERAHQRTGGRCYTRDQLYLNHHIVAH